MSIDSRPSVDRQSIECRSTVDRVSIDTRSTVDRVSTATSTDIAVDIAVDSTYSKHDPICLPRFHDGLSVYLSRKLETVQKTAMRVVFPCFLYEEAFVKTSLVTLSDRRQARLTDKLFKKRLQAQEFTAPTKCQSL